MCLAAAGEVIERDQVTVDPGEVERALTRFMVEVAPGYDFRFTRLQEHIAGDLPDLGPVDGHPDVILADGRIFDVKTAKRPKLDTPTVELGFYALIGSEVAGIMVPEVGYWTYVRVTRPYWQTVAFPVTDELLRWTVEKAAAFVRAKRADEVLNRGEYPNNWSFTGGPSFASACATCQYAPMCPIALKGASDDNAA